MSTTKERFPLHDAPGLIRDEVAALTPHVERLYGESPVYTKNILDEDGSVLERLTEHGYRAAKGAEEVALASFALLVSATGRHATPTPHHQLLEILQYDAAKLFGVFAAALAGLQGHPDPCMATWGMNDLLGDLLERCDSDEARKAADFVYRNPADTPEQIHALVEEFGLPGTWRAEARDEEETGTGSDTVSEEDEAPAPGNAREAAHHPLGAIVSRERRPFTAAETRTLLLDAFRPLRTHLAPFATLTRDDDLHELGMMLDDAATEARTADRVVRELYRWHGHDDLPGVDVTTMGDLTRTVMKALEGCMANVPRDVSSAQYVACLVHSAYETILAAEVEDVVHV